eukprot:669519-Rhodomonas_salina.1
MMLVFRWNTGACSPHTPYSPTQYPTYAVFAHSVLHIRRIRPLSTPHMPYSPPQYPTYAPFARSAPAHTPHQHRASGCRV